MAGAAGAEVLDGRARTKAEGKKINWKDGLKAIATLIRCRMSP